MTNDLGHQIRRRREALGLSQARLARACGLTQTTVSIAERGSRFTGAAGRILDALAETESLAAAEHRALAVWADAAASDPDLALRRLAMVKAASVLRKRGEILLAHWLLIATPAAAMTVAAGVAAHALRRIPADNGHQNRWPHPWDILADAGALDLEQADAWFLTDGAFEWGPEPKAVIS